MKKIFKLCILLAIIFTSSLAGINIYAVNAEEINIEAPIVATEGLPDSYNLADYIDIGVENQQPYGICYAFASLTSLETYLALNYGEYYDFSELHFVLSMYLQDGFYNSIDEALNDGGSFANFFTYVQKEHSIVLEQDLAMSSYTNTTSGHNKMINDYNALNENFTPIVKVNDVAGFPRYAGDKSQYTIIELTNFRNSVKSHIMQFGSLTAGINASKLSANTKYYKITDSSLLGDGSASAINFSIDHLISIVGWDDNYDANGTWENKGAYICLNSWGKNFGDKGYFYVSYDDYFIEYNIQGVKRATLSTQSSSINSYKTQSDKTYTVIHTLSSSGSLFQAHIVDVSEHIGENITAIDNFMKGSSSKFYINFFDNESSAINNLNQVTTPYLKSSYSGGEFAFYNKYYLNTPLEITKKYALVVVETKSVTRTTSIASQNLYNISLTPTYYSSQLGHFSTSNTWNTALQESAITNGYTLTEHYSLPLILHTNASYNQVTNFTSNVDSYINSKYLKNNAIFYNKTLKLNISNAGTIDCNAVKITKTFKNNFYDVTNMFEISQTATSPAEISIKMIGGLNSNFNTGNYILSIPLADTTIYRVFEVQDVVSYPITYHLDGGNATNPSIYTNKYTTLNLISPTKEGYTFAGWYLDSNFTTEFNQNDLPYTALDLYAKWDFALPQINNSSDIEITYSKDLNALISVTASHVLVNEYNTFSYQWYKREVDSAEYIKVEGATSNSLTLSTVAQSGYYVCQVTFTITDPALTNTPCVKVLEPSNDNEICVTIDTFKYIIPDWDYTEAFSYNAQEHIVQLGTLPEGVSASYTNNNFTDVGEYTARAELSYDDMDGNAVAVDINGNIITTNIKELTWEIRKAKIVITINDISSDKLLSNEDLAPLYSCTIEHEYLPDNLSTLEQKLAYLNLQYVLTDTAYSSIKTISATTDEFDIYDIVINNAEYKIIIKTLTSNGITSTNEDGFIVDCEFSASKLYANELSEQAKTLLENNHLVAIGGYKLSYTYLDAGETYIINMPINREDLYNKIEVYIVKNGQLVKVDNLSVSSNGITFTSSEKDATFILTHIDASHTTNTEMLIAIVIIGVFIALAICIIINHIKRKSR